MLNDLLSGSVNLTDLQTKYGKDGSSAFTALYDAAAAELGYST